MAKTTRSTSTNTIKGNETRYYDNFRSYEPHVWWFELSETPRRLLLTGFLVLCLEGTASQVSIAILITSISMLVYTHYQPYIDNTDDIISRLSQVMIFLTLFAALLLKVGVAEDEGYNLQVLGAVLVILNLGVLVFGAIIAFRKHVQLSKKTNATATTAAVEEAVTILPPHAHPQMMMMVNTIGRPSQQAVVNIPSPRQQQAYSIPGAPTIQAPQDVLRFIAESEYTLSLSTADLHLGPIER